ncbi:MAG: hypothetical protein JKY73_03225 [Lutibacter sp.]|nr:hypothetical protein [Lutibacter sp.]
MKKNYLFLVITVLAIISSCEKNDDYEYYNLATPVLIGLDQLRESIDVLPPTEILVSGKIYSYKNYVFVNDKNKGIHIIDNTNPENPVKISFLNIPGNVDISVKDNMLYANSLIDLVVFDISDILQVKMIKILEDVFPYHYEIPEGADYVDWYKMNSEEGYPIDWVITREKRLINHDGIIMFDTMANSESTVGNGGSLARFKIVEQYLYVVDSHSIHIFDIENLDSPNKKESIHAGFDIETIFNKDNYLFLGSKSGMYIYDIVEPSLPQFVSEFQHGTACDPVVVDDNFAYITLRAGNSCGAFESSLQIVDISNIVEPVLIKTYSMDGPYGLGIKDEKLFICDGSSGLKVYDKTDVNNLVLLNHFENINTFDVIPLENHLLMIGDGVLYQYTYKDNAMNLLSSFNLN